MRVIAGTARGMRLVAPRGTGTRPTADRVREALFNILQSRIDLTGTRILDICAGTGGLGIEALSRGADSCCFVENDRNALSALNKNIESTGCTDRGKVVALDAVRALKVLADKNNSFNIIFFDPPYRSNLYELVMDSISSRGLLDTEGILVAESSVRLVLPDQVGGLVKIDRRTYGDTAVEFYNWEKE